MSRALVLIGSPKPKASASRSFAEAVAERLEVRGWETSVERALPATRSAEAMGRLIGTIAEADLVVLSFPVYIDTLPAPLVAVLEEYVAWGPGQRSQMLAVLTQCGFPEASHCDVAVEVCRRFAAEAGMTWAGHLAFGMGGGIESRRPEQSPLAGRMPALEAAAEALAAGEPIPAESTAAFAKPLVPPWGYPLMGRFMWGRAARKSGCTERLGLRRYARARA